MRQKVIRVIDPIGRQVVLVVEVVLVQSTTDGGKLDLSEQAREKERGPPASKLFFFFFIISSLRLG